MKKTLVFLTVLGLLLMMSAGVFAAKPPLVYNPGFEEGLDPWFSLTGDTDVISLAKDVVRSGKNSCFVTNRKEPWYCVAQDVTEIVKMNGQGVYYATAYYKTKKGFDNANPVLYIETDDGFKAWYGTGAVAIDNTEWYMVGASDGVPLPLNGPDNAGKVTWTGNLTKAILYLSTNGKTDYYIDDVHFWKADQKYILSDLKKNNESTSTTEKEEDTSTKTETKDTSTKTETTKTSATNPKTGDAAIFISLTALAASGAAAFVFKKRK